MPVTTEPPARRGSLRVLAVAALPLALTAALAAAPRPAGAGGDTLSDSPLLSAESPAERRCLAEATRLRKLITIHTGRAPQNSSYSADYDDIVRACQEGRYDDAADKQAVIWAALTLHLPHRS